MNVQRHRERYLHPQPKGGGFDIGDFDKLPYHKNNERHDTDSREGLRGIVEDSADSFKAAPAIGNEVVCGGEARVDENACNADEQSVAYPSAFHTEKRYPCLLRYR